MPTKNSNDNDKERRPSSGGTQSQGQRQNQGYTYGRSLDRDLPYEVETVVDQLDDMIFGGLRKPTRQCDDKEPRPSDDGTLTYAAELMKGRLKKTFVQHFVHIDGSPIDSLSDDVTNDILLDETFDTGGSIVTNDILPDETFDAGGSISEKVDLSKRRGTSARTLPRVMSPLSQPRRMIGKPLATRMLKRLSRTSFVDNDAEATAAATISHTSMENRPALIVEAVDYNENVANVNDEGRRGEEHVMIVEQVDYGIEKRSVFNRQIKGNVAKVEVDDSYNKKNEATTTGPKIQPQSTASCDGRDEDKDELGATSTLEEYSNYAEKESNTTEDVEMDAGGNIVVRDEPSASPTKRYEGVEESVSDSKKKKGKKKRRAVCLLVTACMIIILIIILGSTQKRNSKQKAADFSGGEPRTLPVPPTSLSSSVPTFKPSTAPVVGASVSVQPTPLPTTDKPVSASPTAASTEDEVVDEKPESIENRPAGEESAGAITFDANQPSGEDDVPTLADESGFVQDAIGNAPVATPSGVPMTVRPTALMDNTVPTQGPSASPVSSSPTQSPSASPVSGSPTAAPVSDPLTASPVSDPPTAAPVTPEPSSAPVSDPPTASPVSDPPTAAPTSFPSTSPTSNPTSLPTPLPIVWEESSPGHLVTNNNRDKATDGIMLAVTAKASTITITSIDILLDSIDTNVPVEVMITQGSYFGYELYSQIWDTVGTYTIPQGNGHSRVTTIQGLDPITIESGKTIGLYILFPEGHEMLIGSGGEVTSDGDIRIYSGSSVPAKFMSVERGVGWSGAIKYDV